MELPEWLVTEVGRLYLDNLAMRHEINERNEAERRQAEESARDVMEEK